MIKNIENFLNITKAALSSVIGTLTGFYFKKYLFENPSINEWWLIAIAIGVFIVLSVVNYSINKLVEKSKWLRRKLLDKHFIEGCWIQKIADESLGRSSPIYSLVYITFDKNHYKVSGESFKLDGTFTANFHSLFSEYNNHTLKYPFLVKSLEFKDNFVFGFSELVFSLTDKIPDRYLGHVSSNIRDKPIMVQAKKIHANESINITLPSDRKKIINLLK